jgi:hypothetical protein
MTVLIISSFGATKNYPDQKMMGLTLRAFLMSLARQTSQDFHLFLSCHDIPDMEACRLPFIHWCRMDTGEKEDDHERTVYPKDLRFPERVTDQVEYEIGPYQCKMMDMSRKTVNSAIEAGLFAYAQGLESFWMLRMDSDDLLAKDHIAFLNGLDPAKTKAVYNKRCHMFDPRRKEAGVHSYKYSTTCNALHMEVREDKIERWDYLCTDHTLFMSQVARDGIPHLEKDFALCIVTNSGNTISERLGIGYEPHTVLCIMTQEIIDRYGLDSF